MSNILEIIMQMNATQALGTMREMQPLIFMVVMVAIAIGAVSVLMHVSTSIEKYRKLKKIFSFLSKLFGYAAYGALTLVIVVVPIMLSYLGVSVAVENPGASLETFKWIGIITGGFIGLALVGYATKNRIWKRIFKFHKEEQSLKVYKANLNLLPISKEESDAD